jgi:tRNA A-37 threonylcarbamoyl transferase component Bud32
MLPEIGTLVDEKYVIESQLGKGGMAVVFAAHHTVLDRKVALKVLSPELPHTRRLLERFLSEARAAARIDSTYVARVFDAGTLDTGQPFIVMERLDGCDLDELVTLQKQLPIGEATDYVLQALQGLAHAHVLGVIHRDLKPANLFLARQADGSNVIKVLDFGIAKLVDDARWMARGELMGSPMYMSPEQVRDADQVDPRADIWSIGVVLYELLTGQTPFQGEGLGDMFAAVLGSTPAPPRTWRQEIPPELDAVILRCLRQSPDERFTDVAELAAALAPFGTGACNPLVDAIERALGHPTGRFARPGFGDGSTAENPRELAAVRVAFADERDPAASYLYGDGTQSPLQANFFAFLEDALDCTARLLVFDDEIARGREDVDRLPRETAAEIERLAGIVTATKDAIAGAPKGPPDSPSARVGPAAIAHLEGLVRSEASKCEATLEAALNGIPAKESAARAGCAKAFEWLLLRHDLPGSILSFELRHGDKDRYTAGIAGLVDYGLRWHLEVDIPAEHALGRVARLEKLARIEVEAPELTGWLKKEIKLRPQRLDRYYIIDLTIDSTNMSMKLRAEPNGEGEGYDVDVDLIMSRFQLFRPAAPEAPYDVSEADTVKLIELHKTLLAVARDLAPHRKRLLSATVDNARLWLAHDPALVVERLIEVIAPIVREIAVHSSSTTELALKRLTADKRREEAFVSKASLLAKLSPVPERRRSVVEPLVLVLESVGIRASQPSHPRVA